MSDERSAEVLTWFGTNVRSLRESRSLTQAALAERVGIEPRHLRAIEHGRASPSFPTMVRLADELDVDVGRLFEPAEAARRRPGRPRHSKR